MQLLERLEAAEGNHEGAHRLIQSSLDAPGAAQMRYHKLRSQHGLADIALATSADREVRARGRNARPSGVER